MVRFGRASDALVSVGVVAVNNTVGIVQEIHAKLVLDSMAVLTRPHVIVVREGVKHRINPSDVSVGDLLIVGVGEQIVADGLVVGQPGR